MAKKAADYIYTGQGHHAHQTQGTHDLHPVDEPLNQLKEFIHGPFHLHPPLPVKES
jgi:hypothetical protein